MKLRQQRGQDGEDAAVGYLQAHGYKVIERNWRPGNALRGEVDCIAWHGKILCFIEVKTRASLEHGWPQEAVTPTKQRQLSRLANAYISVHRLPDTPCRFDVVEIWLPNQDTPKDDTQKVTPHIALRQNAFDYCEAGPRRPHGARIF